jgi:hypothetical protein
MDINEMRVCIVHAYCDVDSDVKDVTSQRSSFIAHLLFLVQDSQATDARTGDCLHLETKMTKQNNAGK